MPRTLIKICGITRAGDGVAALRAGADWLGFIRWAGSARYRPIEECASVLAEIRAAAPGPFEAVGVYVDAGREVIEAEIEAAGFDRAQLHGGESLEFARSLGVPAIKVIKIRDAASIGRAEDYPGLDLLTDTADAALPGGTGRAYDPKLLADLARRRRVIVAGGLDAGNVGEAVKLLRPMGVDVSSGVETAPGVKDAGKMEAFVRAVRRAEGEE